MLAGDRGQLLALLQRQDEAQRVVHGRHAVHRLDPALAAQRTQCLQVGALRADRHRDHFHPQHRRDLPESRIGQRIHGDGIARAQCAQQGDGQSVLGALDQGHASGIGSYPALHQVVGHELALLGPTQGRLVQKQCFQVALLREVAQGPAKLRVLAECGGHVGVEVDAAAETGQHVAGHALCAERLAHIGAATDLTDDQAHPGQLGIDAAGGGKRQIMAAGALAVGGQAGSRAQVPALDVRYEAIDYLLEP
ncbi:hypothetical protein G6F65_013691 [Rhizopus arrhizus]|nr:hypothetical protein G6F65_013691 [Rhizopus arrhizus]